MSADGPVAAGPPAEAQNHPSSRTRKGCAMNRVPRMARSSLPALRARGGDEAAGGSRGIGIPAGPGLTRGLRRRAKSGKAEHCHWSSFPTKRQVVIAVHTVAAAMRLKDLVG